MHKNVILLFGIYCLLFFSIGCSEESKVSQSKDKMSLRFQPKVGTTYNILMEVIQNVTQTKNGQKEVSDQSVNAQIQVKVKELDSQGNFLLEADFKRIQLTRSEPLAGTVELDSRNLSRLKRGVDSAYAKAIRTLMNKQVRLKMDSLGNIVERSVLDIIQIETDTTKKQKPTAINILGEQTTSKQNLELLFAYFPKDSIAVKGSWEQKIQLDSQLPMSIDTRYKIDTVYNDTILISRSSEISLNKKKELADKEDVQKTISGDQTGKMWVSGNSGWPVRAEIYSEIKVMERIGLKILRSTTTTIKFNTSSITD